MVQQNLEHFWLRREAFLKTTNFVSVKALST